MAGSLVMLTVGTGEVRPLEDMENEIIRFAISHYRGQMSEVAAASKSAARRFIASSTRPPPPTRPKGRPLTPTERTGDCGTEVAKIADGPTRWQVQNL